MFFRRHSVREPLFLRTALAVALVAVSSPATVVERIVAVVGDRAILLSELKERSRPYLRRIGEQVPPGAQRSAAVSQVYGTLLARMVDEELQLRAAMKAHLNVTGSEIDDAIARIATQNGVEMQVLIDEATRSGLTLTQYRDEIRRQLLDAKLINLRVGGRIRVSDEDVKAAYQQLVMTERAKLAFRAAWIRLPQGSGKEAAKSREFAVDLAARAQADEDFASLARRHSIDDATREMGGLLDPMAPGSLPAALDKAVLALGPGEVSGPVEVGDSYVIIKLVERDPSALPEFKEAKGELQNRVFMDKMDKARRHWLDGLKKRTHVDVRL